MFLQTQTACIGTSIAKRPTHFGIDHTSNHSCCSLKLIHKNFNEGSWQMFSIVFHIILNGKKHQHNTSTSNPIYGCFPIFKWDDLGGKNPDFWFNTHMDNIWSFSSSICAPDEEWASRPSLSPDGQRWQARHVAKHHGMFGWRLGVNPKIRVVNPPKWMVYFMENPINMDDLGVPLFLDQSQKISKICWHLRCSRRCFFLSLPLQHMKNSQHSFVVNSTCIKQKKTQRAPEALYHSGPAKSGIGYDEAANPWEFSAGRFIHRLHGGWKMFFTVLDKIEHEINVCNMCFKLNNHLIIHFRWCVQFESYYHFTSKFPENKTNINKSLWKTKSKSVSMEVTNLSCPTCNKGRYA